MLNCCDMHLANNYIVHLKRIFDHSAMQCHEIRCLKLQNSLLIRGIILTVVISAIYYLFYRTALYYKCPNASCKDYAAKNNCSVTIINLLPALADDSFDCILHTGSLPHTKICLHPLNDIAASAAIRRQDAPENYNIEAIVSELSSDALMGFIDIGANIGYYSLKIAKMGYRVIAVEPIAENFHRFHNSIKLNSLGDRITLVTNPLSNVRQDVLLKFKPSNPADSRVHLQQAFINGVTKCKNPCPMNTATARAVLLDDLLDVIPFQRAVMKIDVQSHEHRVLQKAELFLATIDVTLIVCEWILIKQFYGQHNEEESIVEEMLRLLKSFHYRPYGNASYESELDMTKWNKWPYDVFWKKIKR